MKRNNYFEDEASEGNEDDESIDFRPNLEFDRLINKPRARLLDIDGLQKYERLHLQDEEAEDDYYDDLSTVKVYRLKCDKGREEESVIEISQKFASETLLNTSAYISGVFAYKSKFPGAIFIEATCDFQAKKSAWYVQQVKKSDAELMTQKFLQCFFEPKSSQGISVQPGNWVKIRSHPLYHNDLGKVLMIDKRTFRATVKVIPREKVRQGGPITQVAPATQELRFETKNEIKTENLSTPISKQSQFYRKSQSQKQQRGPKLLINMAKSSEDDKISTRFVYEDLQAEFEDARKMGFEVIKLPVRNLQTNNFMLTPKDILEFFPDVSNFVKLPHTVRAQLKMINMKEQQKSDQQIEESKISTPKIPKVKLNDYVYIVDGEYLGQQGIIISLNGYNAKVSTTENKVVDVHVLDLNHKNVNVGIVDMRSAYKFKIFDLVVFGAIEFDVGCIFSIKNQSAYILDLNNKCREVALSRLQIISSKQTKGQDVLVLRGYYKDKQGSLIATYQSRTYIFNQNFTNSLIVEHDENVRILNSFTRQVVNKYTFLIGQTITIKRGSYRDYRGLVTEVKPNFVTLQLLSKNFKVTIPIDTIDPEEYEPTPQRHHK